MNRLYLLVVDNGQNSLKKSHKTQVKQKKNHNSINVLRKHYKILFIDINRQGRTFNQT
jgi:hypothetical protein